MMNDEYYIKAAIKEAKKAYEKKEVPVGAIIVIDGVIVARAHNLRQSKHNCLAHAEIIAINKTCKKLKRPVLDGATIYITVEPCLMCVGAIYQARINRVVFGAFEPKFGALGSVTDISGIRGFNHSVTVTSGILKEEIKELMLKFFKELRSGVLA